MPRLQHPTWPPRWVVVFGAITAAVWFGVGGFLLYRSFILSSSCGDGMRLATGLAFCMGLAVATSLAALDRQQWEAKYVTALQAKATAPIKSDRK